MTVAGWCSDRGPQHTFLDITHWGMGRAISICYLVSRNRAWIRHLVFFYDVLHHNTLFTLEMWTGLTTSCVKLKLLIVYNTFFREHTSRQVGWQWCKSLGCEHGYMVCILCHPLFIFTFTSRLVRFRHLKRVTSFWEKWWFWLRCKELVVLCIWVRVRLWVVGLGHTGACR